MIITMIHFLPKFARVLKSKKKNLALTFIYFLG